jgi:hypothetical protein
MIIGSSNYHGDGWSTKRLVEGDTVVGTVSAFQRGPIKGRRTATFKTTNCHGQASRRYHDSPQECWDRSRLDGSRSVVAYPRSCYRRVILDQMDSQCFQIGHAGSRAIDMSVPTMWETHPVRQVALAQENRNIAELRVILLSDAVPRAPPCRQMHHSNRSTAPPARA